MHQLTIRGFDEDIERRIREVARRERISLNKAVLRLLRQGAGIGVESDRADVVGDSLDDLIGTWDDAETRAVREAVRVFDAIDEDLWR